LNLRAEASTNHYFLLQTSQQYYIYSHLFDLRAISISVYWTSFRRRKL